MKKEEYSDEINQAGEIFLMDLEEQEALLTGKRPEKKK